MVTAEPEKHLSVSDSASRAGCLCLEGINRRSGLFIFSSITRASHATGFVSSLPKNEFLSFSILNRIGRSSNLPVVEKLREGSFSAFLVVIKFYSGPSANVSLLLEEKRNVYLEKNDMNFVSIKIPLSNGIHEFLDYKVNF